MEGMTQAEKNAVVKGLAIISSAGNREQLRGAERYIDNYVRLYGKNVGEVILRVRLRRKARGLGQRLEEGKNLGQVKKGWWVRFKGLFRRS